MTTLWCIVFIISGGLIYFALFWLPVLGKKGFTWKTVKVSLFIQGVVFGGIGVIVLFVYAFAQCFVE